jgi:hypothetical protein
VIQTGYQHIFDKHLLPALHLIPEQRQGSALIWPSVFLLICFALLIVIRVTSFSKLIKLVQSCFNMQAWRQLEREEFNPFKFYSILLSVFFLFNLTFFVYKINSVYKWVLSDQTHFEQFVFLLVAILVLFMIKGLLNKIVSVSVNDNKLIPEFVHSSFVISQTFGIFLFPCLILAELGKFEPGIFLSMACIVLAASQIFKWYRGILFSLVDHRVGLLQIFVYFCALEILPALIMVKFIIEKF